MNGYCGKLLFVDLTDGSFEERGFDEKMARKYVGGYGIGGRILYDEMKPGTDPLGPDSMLGFTTSPLNASGAFLAGRYTVVHKSPVTGGFNDANSGGYFGPELKKAGFDAVFVKGKASKPVYIWINDGKYEIRDASKLWGKNVTQTEEALQAEIGDSKIRVASIGPAGEMLSLISAIMNDEHRAAARGGCGAVMGSKNLKAVVVRGTGEVSVADPEGLKAANKDISNTLKGSEMAKGFSQLGTSGMTVGSALSGDSPVKNWGGTIPADFGEKDANPLGGDVTDPKYRSKRFACHKCPVGCGAIYDAKKSTYPVEEHAGRPEYETGAAFGCLVLNSDADVLIKCNHICNLYGLDTISAGGTVAWAIECYENGLLTKEDTGGLEMTWGNGKSIVAATQQMADQSTDFGKLLALGSRAAAKKIGKGEEYVIAVNGIELPMHDPRFGPGFARQYRIDPTPARHVKGGRGIATMFMPPEEKYKYEGVGEMDQAMTAMQEVLNVAGLCIFKDMTGVEGITVKLLPPVTGWDFDEAEEIETGMRLFHLRHAFNLREGLTPEDSILPPRCVGETPLESGPLKDVTVDYKAMEQEWFRVNDWDPATWRPSRAAMEKLGLGDIADDLNL